MIDIPDGNENEWLELLKPYQKKPIMEMLKKQSAVDVAKIWLASNGHTTISPFGGNGASQAFWDSFKKEFDKFLCDDQSYKKEKAELSKQGKVTKTLLVSTISVAIASALPVSAVLITPVVVVLLSIVAKMTKNAYCQSELCSIKSV